MSKRVIGVLGTPTVDDENDAVIALYNDYKNVIVKNNGIPFMIPPLLDIDYYSTKLREIPELTLKEKEMYNAMLDMCDGLLIPGGYKMYEFERYITKKALERNMPILGICKGMQLLASIDNEENCIELNETSIEHRQRNKKYVHSLNIVNGTLLSSIIKQGTIMVNSKHRYHVTKVNRFKVSAYAEDGLIEAIELPNKKFVMGLQWHPEKMERYDKNATKIFERFVEEANNYNKVKK